MRTPTESHARRQTDPSRAPVHPILHAVRAKNIWLLMVDPRNRPDAVWREEFPLIEHDYQYLSQLIAIDDGEQTSISFAWRVHASDVVRQIFAMLHEPFQPPLEAFKPIADLRLDCLHCEQRNQPDH